MDTLRVKDTSGQPVKGWRFGRVKAVHVGVTPKPRHVQGWSLIAPDGYERFNEGNYEQFVPFANRVLENYGCQPCFS